MKYGWKFHLDSESSESGTEQTVSFKNELKFVNVDGSVCSFLISEGGLSKLGKLGVKLFFIELGLCTIFRDVDSTFAFICKCLYSLFGTL